MSGTFVAIWLALSGLLSADITPPDTVVVCSSEYRAALQPWLKLRAEQGHVAEIVTNQGSAEDVRGRIRAVNKRAPVKFIMLVGAASGGDSTATAHAGAIPVHLEPAKVVTRWGSEPQIASDNWYADLKGDGLPSAAIGRLTVQSTEELRRVVSKILRYETNADAARWRARINFIAGVGGFNPIVDSLIESTAKRMISSGVPGGYQTTFTYANWRSPCCPDPRQFKTAVADRINEGCLFWVYMGHASRQA